MKLDISNSLSFTSSSLFFNNPCKKTAHSHQPWQNQQKKKERESFACTNQETPAQNGSILSNAEGGPGFMLINEKVGNTLLRKYVVDDHKGLSIKEAQIELPSHVSNTSFSRDFGGISLPATISQLFKDLFLPTDFPDSVSHDYLQYMIWQFPTNVTGWACSTLVTSSLLKAVGLEAWAGTTVAATAAIKWVSKDGLGAFGRLFIGGRFGRAFDDDPKQWRMHAEVIGSFGSIFELITPIKPEWFLPLATLGRLTKAIGKGLKDPSFTVILNHFAVAGNMGEVSAKEEVWEVVAELIGIAIGVALLASPSLATSYSTLVLTWASIRSLHLWLRYQSLASLQFSTINFKRAFIMAQLHVNESPMPGVLKCNKMENILLPWQFSKPYLHLGCSLRDAVDGQISVPELEEIFDLFSDELYVLILKSNALYQVDMHFIFKEGATNVTVLRCIWQAEWIINSIMSEKAILNLLPFKQTSWMLNNHTSTLAKSLQELNRSFDDFLCKMEQAGWETSKLVLKVPKGAPYITVSGPMEHCNYDSTSL